MNLQELNSCSVCLQMISKCLLDAGIYSIVLFVKSATAGFFMCILQLMQFPSPPTWSKSSVI